MKQIDYNLILKQIESLSKNERNLIANLSNITSVIHESLGVLWTGFYFVEESTNQLVLGPFQGPVACTRIPYGKGVCGQAWAENKTINVPDVNNFSNHIACSALSKSEIVIPLQKNNAVSGVLDIDSSELNFFDETDFRGLAAIAKYIESIL